MQAANFHLKKYSASFSIYEAGGDDDWYKRLNVKFDGLGKVAIFTNCRYDELVKALDGTGMEVEKI